MGKISSTTTATLNNLIFYEMAKQFQQTTDNYYVIQLVGDEWNVVDSFIKDSVGDLLSATAKNKFRI